jgi:hypothetical protein
MQLPQWLAEIVKKFKCPVCEALMSEDHVFSYGWRINEKDPEKDFFVDYLCSECDRKILIPLQGVDLEKFAMQVMEETMVQDLDQDDLNDYDSGEPESYNKSNPDAPKAKKRLPKSKINDEEVGKFVQEMHNCEDYSDFLKMIGLTEEKIKEYNGPNDENK